MIELLTFSKCYLISFKEKKTDNIAMNVLPYYLIPLCMPSLVAQTVKNLPAVQETRVQSLVRKIPWRRAWRPTPVFLPEESHGQRSLAGYSPWGLKESDMTEATWHTHIQLKQSHFIAERE